MRCSASGDSSAPGTVTTTAALSPTPDSASARVAPLRSNSPIAGLKRDSTMPTRMCSARVFTGSLRNAMAIDSKTGGPHPRGSAESRGSALLGLGLDVGVPRDLQPEAGHAGHLARAREQAHAADV